LRKLKNQDLEELVKLLLPEVLVDNFNLTKVDKDKNSENLRIYLEEKGDIPKELSHLKLHSKGFLDEITIQDFPIRNYKVLLHVKRRKWKDLESKKNVSGNWELVAQGTRMTIEFAAFLKEFNRYTGY
jgi:hypothetical protein